MNEDLKQLDLLMHKQIAYSNAMSLLYVDGATVAPSGSAENRGETLGILSEEMYSFCTSPDTIALVDRLYAQRDHLDSVHRRVVEEMRRDIDDMRAVPMEDYVAYQKLVTASDAVWHQAKAENNYALFKPYLKKLIEATQKLTAFRHPEADCYDALLNEFEKGLNKEKCNAFFDLLRQELVPFIKKIRLQPKPDCSPIEGHFPMEQQRLFSRFLMDLIGLDNAHCVISETEHPFTDAMTKYDVRITTHYHEEDFSSSMFSVIHEGGHALYALNLKDELAYTALNHSPSMSLDESQSRFYENIIGRSRAFIRLILPELRRLFPALQEYSEEALYRALNIAEPSLIRTEADELTYCLHIMIRYELEQRLFDGTLSVDDLPSEWNRLYKEYLGVDVPSDSEGVLQDSHWAGAMFGYFPSYALGSAYGAQLLDTMQKEIDFDHLLESGRLDLIKQWLAEHIWQHGNLFDPQELLQSVVHAPFDPMYYIRYLKQKYSELYQL